MTSLRMFKFLPILLLGLSGCQDALDSVTDKVEHPLPAKLINKMKAHDMSTRSPIMMRIFKEENVLEVWKQKANGRYDKIASYQICKWSGKLGPKFEEGDRQAPEGYYRIYPRQMNPNSSYYLSFNMGYPNSYDRSHGRTGSNLMVHGACSSAGCYSMTDEQVLQIYAFARDAFRGGQKFFLVQALPFRMTPENMARHSTDPNFEFWKMLKIGYDHFELTKRPPKVDVCDRRYVFNRVPDDENVSFRPNAACPASHLPPSLATAYASYEKTWNAAYAKALIKLTHQKTRTKSLSQEESNFRAKQARAEAESIRAEREAARLASTIRQTPVNPNGGIYSSARVGQPIIQQTTPSGSAPIPQVNPDAPQQASKSEQTSQKNKPFWNIWSRP